jgi:hypothetical protein
MITNNILLLIFIAVLFVLSSFLAQKTEKQFIIKFGIILTISFFITLANLLLILIDKI